MRTYFDIIEYEKMSYVYNFLHGQMLSRAKVFILSIFMRRRIKKVKRSIMKVKVNFKGILHLLEIF